MKVRNKKKVSREIKPWDNEWDNLDMEEKLRILQTCELATEENVDVLTLSDKEVGDLIRREQNLYAARQRINGTDHEYDHFPTLGIFITVYILVLSIVLPLYYTIYTTSFYENTGTLQPESMYIAPSSIVSIFIVSIIIILNIANKLLDDK